MDFESNDTREYFLSFALVSKCRNGQKEEGIDYLKKREFPPGIEDNYSRASSGCELMARKRGSDYISRKDVDKWFLENHNRFSSCKAYRGVVIWKGKTKAKVITAMDTERKYKIELRPDVEVGSKVVVHNNHIIDVLE